LARANDIAAHYHYQDIIVIIIRAAEIND